MGTLAELTSLGALLGEFSQSKFGERWSSIEGANLEGGYCAGVCLDWMRRVLLSKADRDPSFLGYEKTKAPEEALRRMAVGYREQAPSYVGETNLTKVIPILKRLVDEPVITMRFSGQARTGIPVASDLAALLLKLWALPELDTSSEPAGLLTRQRVQQLIASGATLPDPQRAKAVASGREWQDMAQVLDTRFKQIRIGSSRQVTKKSFSSVSVRRSKQSTVYASGGHWIAELSSHGFDDGCCTILTFERLGSGGGHAVAVHQLGADYRFFDPNFGAFRYTLDNLERALAHLFWKPMITSEDGVLDGAKAVYLRRKKAGDPARPLMNDVAYTVFERA